MTDEELIARLRPDGPPCEIDVASLAADRIEALLKERDEAQISAEFFQSEVKLRNRIPATADPVAVLMRQLDTTETKLMKAVQALRIIASYKEPEWSTLYSKQLAHIASEALSEMERNND